MYVGSVQQILTKPEIICWGEATSTVVNKLKLLSHDHFCQPCSLNMSNLTGYRKTATLAPTSMHGEPAWP